MREATKAERKRYSKRGLPVEKLPIFCSPILYEPVYRIYGMDSDIEFTYRHKGKLCKLREIRNKRYGDKEDAGLFEFENGDMVWLHPDELTVKPGDGKVFGAWRIVRTSKSWL